MKQTILIIVLSFLFINKGFSQERNIIDNTLSFKIMPLSLLAYTPRHRVGLEYISNGRMGYSLDFGIGNNFLNPGRFWGLSWGKDYSCFVVRPELKYILIKHKEYFIYGAMEFMHMEMKEFLESGEYQKEGSSIGTYYKSARFTKQKTAAHLKGGVNFIALDRLHFDFYGGIGFAKRTISYTDVVNPVDGTSIFVEWIPQPHLFEGESIITHLTLGLKIGYTIWKKQED